MIINDEEWITISEAVRIVSINNGKQVTPGYLRKLASLGKLRTWSIDARTKLYDLDQVRTWRVGDRPGRVPADNPSPSALRKRKHVERQLKK